MINTIALAWLLAVVLMTIVFLYSWKQSGSLYKAWIIMLLFGKTIAVFYWASGLNKTVLVLEFKHRITGQVLTINLSASLLVFLSLFFTLLGTLVYASISSRLPREYRRIMGVNEDEQ